MTGSSWSWSYDKWIYHYLCNQCLSPITWWVRILPKRGILDTTLCYKVCQWLATGRWFALGTPVSSTNKIDRHDIIDILLKVALNTITITRHFVQTICEDTKGVIRSRKSKDRQYIKGKRKWHTMIYKRLHRKLKIEQREPQQKLGVNPCVPVGLAVLVPLVISVVLLLKETNVYIKAGTRVALSKTVLIPNNKLGDNEIRVGQFVLSELRKCFFLSINITSRIIFSTQETILRESCPWHLCLTQLSDTHFREDVLQYSIRDPFGKRKKNNTC